MEKQKFKEFDNCNVYMWIEQDSSVMLRASDRAHNDPAVLSGAHAIAEYLIFLADELEKE